jgi:hypothetical protein
MTKCQALSGASPDRANRCTPWSLPARFLTQVNAGKSRTPANRRAPPRPPSRRVEPFAHEMNPYRLFSVLRPTPVTRPRVCGYTNPHSVPPGSSFQKNVRRAFLDRANPLHIASAFCWRTRVPTCRGLRVSVSRFATIDSGE